jgi:hypothetical protein
MNFYHASVRALRPVRKVSGPTAEEFPASILKTSRLIAMLPDKVSMPIGAMTAIVAALRHTLLGPNLAQRSRVSQIARARPETTGQTFEVVPARH